MRLRLFLAFALVVVISILSVSLITWRSAATEVRTFVARGGMMGIDILTSSLEAYYQQVGTWEGVQPLLQDFRNARGMGQGLMAGNGLWLRVANASGSYVADNRGQPSAKMSASERQAAVPLHSASGAVVGYLVAAGGSSSYSEQVLIDRLVRAGWIAAGIAGALALLLAFLLSYRLLIPVQDLTRAAAKMDHGDLSQRVQVRSNDELGTLGQAFNQMAASLQRAEQNRQAMTADIAHELRTPIAIQRAHLEALQDGIYPLTQENLQPVLDQTELLTRLVEDLRTLALADAGVLKMECSPVEISSLVRRIVERFLPEAENRGVRLGLVVEKDASSCVILADAGRVEQILNNLLSNALRYTPTSGVIQVEVSCGQEQAEMRVADTGPGIAPEDMPRLFERFYRAEKSRSRKAGGTGLGLAIARQIALAHRGSLSAENRPEGGAVFTLRLPKNQSLA